MADQQAPTTPTRRVPVRDVSEVGVVAPGAAGTLVGGLPPAHRLRNLHARSPEPDDNITTDIGAVVGCEHLDGLNPFIAG
jgi:hypothetical protein